MNWQGTEGRKKKMNNDYLIVAGGGKFGEIAVKYALKKGYKTLLIDANSDCKAAKHAVFQTDDLEEFLSKLDSVNEGTMIFLNSDIAAINSMVKCVTPEFIIPVLPVHLLLVLIKNFLVEHGIRLKASPELAKSYLDLMKKEFILGVNFEQGVIYLSHARLTEICPDYCPGPPTFCPHFKREKSIPMITYLKNLLDTPDLIRVEENEDSRFCVVAESHQIIPGLGGFLGTEIEFILNALTSSLRRIKKQTQFIISTACNCHGIVHFMKMA